MTSSPYRDARVDNVVGIQERRHRLGTANGALLGTLVAKSEPVMHHPDVAAPTVRDSRDRRQRRAYFDFAERSAALASPTRVQLAVLLCQSPAGGECGRILAASVGLSETTVSHHLRLLRHVGLIESQRRGISVYHVPTADLISLCGSLTEPVPDDASSEPHPLNE